MIVRSIEELKPGKHYVIFRNEQSVYSDGYGGTGREDYLQIEAYASEEEWRSMVKTLVYVKGRPAVIHVPEVKFELKMEIE